MTTTERKKKTTAKQTIARKKAGNAGSHVARGGASHVKFPAAITAAIGAAHDKKAADVVVLNLRKSSAFTDYFILCTGHTVRQVTAIADAVQEALRALKLRPTHVEGYDRAEWVLMDYFDFIVHVFTPGTRQFYSLDRLWGQAERIEVPAPGDARAS
ncbi:MAG: ribosome silencing factor [Acidobacteria bacterium]|nr:ribosome silencing factor [Acidobacteriota bacterium]